MPQDALRKPPKVSVHILTWNSLGFIVKLLESLDKQTYQDFSILIIDNASTDGTIEFLEDYIHRNRPPLNPPLNKEEMERI